MSLTFPLMDDYSERLRAAVKRKKVSVRLLANATGMSYQGVRKVLLGETRAMNSINNSKAAEFLEVNPDWLATGEGEMLAGSLGPASSTSTFSESATISTAQAKERNPLEHIQWFLDQMTPAQRAAAEAKLLLAVVAIWQEQQQTPAQTPAPAPAGAAGTLPV